MSLENELTIQEKAGIAEETARRASKVLDNNQNDFYAEVLIESAAEQALRTVKEIERESMRTLIKAAILTMDMNQKF